MRKARSTVLKSLTETFEVGHPCHESTNNRQLQPRRDCDWGCICSTCWSLGRNTERRAFAVTHIRVKSFTDELAGSSKRGADDSNCDYSSSKRNCK